MRIELIPLRCLACRHEWTGEVVMDAPAKVVTASMRALVCPECHAGWHRIVMREQEAAA